MNDVELISYDNVDVLPCLLVPLAEYNLLLPTVSVAEMVPYEMPFHGDVGPNWYLGEFYWRNIPVPLVSYEVMNGQPNPGVTTRARVAILNTTGQSEHLNFIALVSQGIPRLAQVENELIVDDGKDPAHPYELMRVKIAAEEAVIPDLERIEKAYLSLDI
ncbi:chemotaxis protein CheW [Sessilibacter sp. MAH2]